MGRPLIIVKGTFLSAIALAALSATPAASATFRELPALPSVPPSIGHPAERHVLVRDVERLAQRRDRIFGLRQAFAQQCAQPRVGGSLSRQCQFREIEIRRETSRLRADTLAMQDRIRRIEAGARRERPNAGAQRADAPDAAKKRLDILRATLTPERDDWGTVLAFIRNRLALGAGDPAVRDVAAYLQAMHDGRIAADQLDNPYYRHGVRRWLAGDYWSAAVAFGRAARDNPDDELIYASFAAAAGRQHATPACRRANRCVRGDVAGWAARFAPESGGAIRRLVREEGKMRHPPELGFLLNRMRAISIHETGSPAKNPSAQVGYQGGSSPLPDGRQTPIGVARSILERWRVTRWERAGLFSRRYRGEAEGLEAGRISSSASSREYLAKLRVALLSRESANPFAGSLTRAQIIRLQR